MNIFHLRITTLAFLATLFFVGSENVLCQEISESQKVENYLNSYLKSFNNRPSSLRNRFVEFLEINEALKTQLQTHFPNHHFYVAKTLYSHWITDDGKANILVVTDSKTGEVVGCRWAIWFSDGSESFNHILENYTASSREDAIEKVSVLSTLLVSLNNWEIGNVKFKGKAIVAELGGAQDPWRLLEVKVNEKNKFGSMSFINPKK